MQKKLYHKINIMGSINMHFILIFIKYMKKARPYKGTSGTIQLTAVAKTTNIGQGKVVWQNNYMAKIIRRKEKYQKINFGINF